jgi:ankyrin repeat protein
VATIRSFYENKVIDLNIGDYDKSCPLYYAVRANQMRVVEYLLDVVKVNVNKIDRWGATPIDYVKEGSKMFNYLQQKGGIRTRN